MLMSNMDFKLIFKHIQGGGVSSLGFSFTHPKKGYSNLHPSTSTPLISPLVMQAQKTKATFPTKKSERLPTSQSVLKSEINNNKY